mgnify:CR=1 FL=1
MVLRRKPVTKREAKRTLKKYVKRLKAKKLKVSDTAAKRLSQTASFITEHLAYLAARHAKARRARKITEKDVMVAERVIIKTRKV